MEQYRTLSEAINTLKEKGFKEDFNQWDADELLTYIKGEDGKKIKIVEFHRFEGTSDMGANSILYALQTSDGKRGLLVDAYGTYANQETSAEIMKGLAIHRQAYDK